MRERATTAEQGIVVVTGTVKAASDMLEALTAELLRIGPLLPPEDRGRFCERFKRAFKALHFVIVDDASDGTASAPDHTFRLDPSEGHFRLLTALHAYDGHGDFVFEGHAIEGARP